MSDTANKEHTIALGDKQVFQAVFRQHYQALCYFAVSIVGDRQEAEDLVQETFSKLWNKRGDFRTGANIKAFLYITTKNACLNSLKSRQRKTSREEAFSYLHEASFAESTFDPLLAETEIISALYQEIGNLPPRCGRVFRMSYLEGRGNEEIASLLGISYNTVRTQKLRALKLIRASLLKKNLLPAFYAYIAFLKMHSW